LLDLWNRKELKTIMNHDGSLRIILLWVGDECSNIAYANNEESDGLEE
jgi:hypothetical protein